VGTVIRRATVRAIMIWSLIVTAHGLWIASVIVGEHLRQS
jgi:hypothetical protein